LGAIGPEEEDVLAFCSPSEKVRNYSEKKLFSNVGSSFIF
jgi:hypothetical protein